MIFPGKHLSIGKVRNLSAHAFKGFTHPIASDLVLQAHEEEPSFRRADPGVSGDLT
jgi:hypothetical protein